MGGKGSGRKKWKTTTGYIGHGRTETWSVLTAKGRKKNKKRKK